jgi:uncharacterized DUF497 family protein
LAVLEFEWDDQKARANARKHGVTFERATFAFADPFAIATLDDREDYGEERFILIGVAEGPLLFVSYTERGDRKRIISARRATRHEQEIYERQTKKAR